MFDPSLHSTARMTSPLPRCVLLAFACLGLFGCAGSKKPAKVAPAATAPTAAASTPPNHRSVLERLTLAPVPLKLNLAIDSTANQNTPLRLDVVLIRDKNFWKTAPSMAAKDWFAQRADLERRYQKKLLVSSWEWVPGQPIAHIVIAVPRGLNGAMVFAAYPSPGTHSAPLPTGRKISISLQPDDFTLEITK